MNYEPQTDAWTIEASSAELGLLRLALTNWRARCEREAATMLELAEDPSFDQAKCRANAAASNDFAAEAIAMLAKLEPASQAEPEPVPEPFAPGTILSSSWGYDQTNVYFYRVEKRAGDWATLQRIAGNETSDGAGTMTGRTVPADPPILIGKPFRRKVHVSNAGGDPFVLIESYAYAHPWDGKPKRVSSYA